MLFQNRIVNKWGNQTTKCFSVFLGGERQNGFLFRKESEEESVKKEELRIKKNDGILFVE